MYVLLESTRYYHNVVQFYTPSIVLAKEWSDSSTPNCVRIYIEMDEYHGEDK
jgi:hypothetical protein